MFRAYIIIIYVGLKLEELLKIKIIAFLYFIFCINISLYGFINDLNEYGSKAVSFSSKLMPCLYISSYLSTLAHESGHALVYKLLFPERDNPKIIIGSKSDPKYPAHPDPSLKLLQDHLVLGLNPLNGAYTDVDLNVNDLMKQPNDLICVYSSGPIVGGLADIIGYEAVTLILNKYFPDVAESLRLPLFCCFIYNFARNFSSLLPINVDGHYIKEIIKYKTGSSNQITNFFSK